MIEINVLSWYTEVISTEKTGNRHVSRRKVVQMTEHNATSLSASLVNRKVYTVCYTGLDALSSFHDTLYEARRSYFGSGKTVHIRARGIFDGLSSPGATLTVALYVYAKEEGEFDVAFAIAAILMVLALVIHLAAELVSRHFQKKKAQ